MSTKYVFFAERNGNQGSKNNGTDLRANWG
jgi:hypothetical protein